MAAKLKLNMEDLSVDSFDTTRGEQARGTVVGEQQCTCYTLCTCPGCPTCDATCPATCAHTCDDATCAGCGSAYTCEVSCNYTDCRFQCQASCQNTACGPSPCCA